MVDNIKTDNNNSYNCGANNKNSIINILNSIGQPYKDFGNYISTSASWRGGDDISSVAIYYNDNKVIDFVLSERYTVNKLFSLLLNKKNEIEVNDYIKSFGFNTSSFIDKSKIKSPIVFDSSILNKLLPIHDYWIKRGISLEVLEELKGGMYAGDLNIYKNRYVFPCFNSKKQIIFVSARDVTGNNKVKWLLKGQKTNAVYPASNNLKHILQANRTVILCESVGDSISLSTCGIKNNLVLFGTEVNLSIINLLLKININKIIISTNDDSLSNGAGNKASVKIYNRLNRYFDKKQLEIKLPVGGNDWNEILVNKSKEEILKQFNNHEKQ